MVLNVYTRGYNKSVAVYFYDEQGKRKLEFWTAGMVRKGVCIAWKNDKVYLIKNNRIVLEREKSGKDYNGPYSYRIDRTIKGYYIITHEYIGRTIRPGRDDDYYQTESYEVYDENANEVTKWTNDEIGLGEYPTDLGLSLITYKNSVYELDSYAKLFEIPERFEIEGCFSADGLLKLNVIGDYRTIYVNVLDTKIIAQYDEEHLDAHKKEQEERRRSYLKSINPVEYGLLINVREAREYLNATGLLIERNTQYATHRVQWELQSKPYICSKPIEWEDLLNGVDLDKETTNKIQMLHHALKSLFLQAPSFYSYVFKFAEGIDIRVFDKYIVLYEMRNSQAELCFYGLNGVKLHKDKYKEDWNKDGLRNKVYLFDKDSFYIYDITSEKRKRFFIDGESVSEVHEDLTRFKYMGHDPISLGDQTIRPECMKDYFCFSNKRYSKEEIEKLSNLDKIDIDSICGLRDCHKSSTQIFKFTYGVYCKTFKHCFVLIVKMTEDEHNDDWLIWFFDYSGKKLSKNTFIINGTYLVRKLIDFNTERIIVRNYNTGEMECLHFANGKFKESLYENGNAMPAKMVHNKYMQCQVKEYIQDYLYVLSPELLKLEEYDIKCPFDNTPYYNIVGHHVPKESVEINGETIHIYPWSIESCMDEIEYRHRNRPNYITDVQLESEYQTQEGIIRIFKFECKPKALCDTSGNIYYDFDVENLSLINE